MCTGGNLRCWAPVPCAPPEPAFGVQPLSALPHAPRYKKSTLPRAPVVPAHPSCLHPRDAGGFPFRSPSLASPCVPSQGSPAVAPTSRVSQGFPRPGISHSPAPSTPHLPQFPPAAGQSPASLRWALCTALSPRFPDAGSSAPRTPSAIVLLPFPCLLNCSCS